MVYPASVLDAKDGGIQFVSKQLLMDHLGVGPASWKKMVADGVMPKPIKIQNLWKYDVDEFLEAVEKLRETNRAECWKLGC